MRRPLMQYGVGQLEELFAKSKVDLKILKQLEQELQYRQVPRALALLAEVQAVMPGASGAAVLAPPSAAQQPELWERPSTAAAPTPATATTVQLKASEPAVKPSPIAAAAKSTPPQTPAMPIEAAYKTLNATPGSPWEAIEQTRRQLVQQSHPDRLRSLSAPDQALLLSEALRVNKAYAVIQRARVG